MVWLKGLLYLVSYFGNSSDISSRLCNSVCSYVGHALIGMLVCLLVLYHCAIPIIH